MPMDQVVVAEQKEIPVKLGTFDDLGGVEADLPLCQVLVSKQYYLRMCQVLAFKQKEITMCQVLEIEQ